MTPEDERALLDTLTRAQVRCTELLCELRAAQEQRRQAWDNAMMVLDALEAVVNVAKSSAGVLQGHTALQEAERLLVMCGPYRAHWQAERRKGASA